MNIHPLFVHFPIGILTLYIIFELVRVRWITKQFFYFELKAILVGLGTISAYLAAFTGEMAEELIAAGENSVVGTAMMPLVERHEMFAGAMTAVFTMLAVSYAFEYCKKLNALSVLTSIKIFACLSSYIQKYAVLLAVLAAIFMFITGGLGAALVYGPDMDPMVTIIYTIFGK